MKTIFILMDSLNRHYLSCYQDTWVRTPNIDRLAKKGVVFDNHFAGSLPCMPARRDLWTGRLSFLETPWSPLQPYDECLTNELRMQKQVYSHLITDHYHYFERNGLGYHTCFNTWEFVRGQEGDPWHPSVKEPVAPVFRGRKGPHRRQDWVNRSFMDVERDEDYPTPQCFAKAIQFLENNHAEEDWHLHLEVFDPHEPFACPQKYLEMYQDDWDGRFHFDWPEYQPIDPTHEGADAVEHIRKCYAATLTMADVWLGKLLDKIDEFNLWDDVSIILTTDHGHLLGDHGYWAKNYMFDYKELVHLPLIVFTPEVKDSHKRVNSLTSIIDLMPTIMELHDALPSEHVQGKSLLHLLNETSPHHDAVLYGYFGKDVNVTDGIYTYCRQPNPGSMVHHHTAIPLDFSNSPSKFYFAEVGNFLKRTALPIYRISVPSYRHYSAPDNHILYNITTDPYQSHPIHDDTLDAEWADKLRNLLRRYDSPASQFARLGLD